MVCVLNILYMYVCISVCRFVRSCRLCWINKILESLKVVWLFSRIISVSSKRGKKKKTDYHNIAEFVILLKKWLSTHNNKNKTYDKLYNLSIRFLICGIFQCFTEFGIFLLSPFTKTNFQSDGKSLILYRFTVF